MYRSFTDVISRSACFSARFAGRNGITKPMIRSTESIRSIGRVNCSEPEKRRLISKIVLLTSARIRAFKVVFEVQHIRHRLVYGNEAAVFFGKGDDFYSQFCLCAGQVPVICGLDMGDPEKIPGHIK